MLPLKWKTYRIINYLFIFCYTLLWSILLIRTGIPHFDKWSEFLTFISILAGSLLLILNAAFNIYIIEKCFPNRIPTRKFLNWTLALFIFSIIGVGFLLFLTGLATYEEFLKPQDYAYRHSRLSLLLLSLLTMSSLSCLYILIQQIPLRKAIRRNHLLQLDNFLA